MPAARTTPRRTASRADVVRAAFEILDESGVAALTMANVAERVGFTTMAVYRHVEGRDDLVEAAVALALTPVIEESDEDLPWLDGVVAWMHAMRACLRAHPWAATRMGSKEGAGQPLQEAVGVLLAHLRRSPLSRRDRARAAAWTGRVTIGILVEELAFPVAGSLPEELKPTQSGRDRRSTPSTRVDDDVLFADVVDQTRLFLTRLAGP